jgi:hypothetical protein
MAYNTSKVNIHTSKPPFNRGSNIIAKMLHMDIVSKKVDFNEIFAANHGIIFYQMDVKIVILNGFIIEKVYERQPLDFEDKHFPKYVLKVKKKIKI